jgi:hypothetical protein
VCSSDLNFQNYLQSTKNKNYDYWNKKLHEIEDKNDLKAIYESDLHHATIKVLQEAMVKIEELSAKVTLLENK